MRDPKTLNIPELEKVRKHAEKLLAEVYSEHFPTATPPKLSDGTVMAILEAYVTEIEPTSVEAKT